MSQRPTSGLESAPKALRIGIVQVFRRYFVAGLATLFPVAVTILFVWQIFLFADGWLGGKLGLQIPGLGLLVTILVILLVGVFSIHFFGRVLFRTIELALSRLPVFRKVYPAVKQLAQFLFNEDERQAKLRGVVLVQYPRMGAYCIAFVTDETSTAVMGRPQSLLSLLLPNPPSPFTGPLIFVPKEEVIPLDLSVEDAVKFIVSCGVVTPPLQAKALSKSVQPATSSQST